MASDRPGSVVVPHPAEVAHTNGLRAGTDEPHRGIRKISVWAFVAIAAVYLVLVQTIGYLATRGEDTEYATFRTTGEIWSNLIIAVGAGFVFVYGVIAWLGWWRPVFVDRKPVQRWVRIVPTVMVLAILGGTYYTGLADEGLGFTLSLLFGALLVGLGEEGMFRGIGVTAFRSNGYSETQVALWTSLLFGIAHSTNIFTEGSSAILQVLVTVAAGYFFYLTRRVGGGLWLAVIMHALWDFGLLSSSIKADSIYPGAALFVLADIVLLILLLVRRKRIEPRPAHS